MEQTFVYVSMNQNLEFNVTIIANLIPVQCLLSHYYRVANIGI